MATAQLQLQILQIQCARRRLPRWLSLELANDGWLTMYRLTEAFPYLLNRVGVRMGELFTRRLAAADLTLPMYRVLAALWEKDDQRLGDLADVTSIELSTLSRMVGKLVGRGLVSRGRPENNGRTVRIGLTTRGKKLVERFIPFAMQHEDISLHGFKSADIARLKADLIAVYRNLDAIEAELDRGKQSTRGNSMQGKRPLRVPGRSVR
jgi:MarR family transcriptional regulator, organic hydroperoxide resistance regulator